MSSNTDCTTTHDKVIHKPSVGKTYRLHFYDASGNYAYVNINPEIIGRLYLTPDDTLTQEVTNDGAILLRKIPRI